MDSLIITQLIYLSIKYAVSQRDSLSDILNIKGPSLFGPNGVSLNSVLNSWSLTIL